uniref:FAD-binding domain-containing protein n=1 Tax=Lotharella oceanica TaxID=641309 RepID=A0A7S2TRM5_9EUKA|mmetsp:Transcript_24959/g.46641  ORF Transcript_24959/g.46641 Transcript_24959/m.46641 type:complete len:103 (+) Transcript_24959:2-310(+)
MGDAAHAMVPATGQGAGLAMEDAVQLGVSLQGGMEEGLRHYERTRKPRCEMVQNMNNVGARQAYNKDKTEERPLSQEEFSRLLYNFEPQKWNHEEQPTPALE